MRKDSRRNFFKNHQEWVDHMYNPGYWVNRISWSDISAWRWTRRHNRFMGAVNAFFSGIMLVVITWSLIQLVQKGKILASLEDPVMLFFLGGIILFGFLFITSIVLMLMPPIQKSENSIAHPRKESTGKKRLPKRRKDYR